jgi:two-component system sensor histidine kinase TctE
MAVAAHLRDADGDGHIDADLPPQAIALRSDSQDSIYYAVRTASGSLVSGDADLLFAAPPEGETRFVDATFRGAPIRIAAYATPVGRTTVAIAVAETLHKRERAAAHLASIVFTDLVQLIGTLALVWIGVRYGCAAAGALGGQIAQRSAHDRPLQAALVPAEVRPLVHALNALFETVREAARAAAIHRRRRAPVAHAADWHHRAARTARSRADAGRIARAPARIARGLRAPRPHREPAARAGAFERTATTREDFARVDLEQLAMDVVAQNLDRSLAAGIDLGVEATRSHVMGSEWLLRELLGNLVDNALATRRAAAASRCAAAAARAARGSKSKTMGPASRSSIACRCASAGAVPGSPGNGCGLGLAIVDEIARGHEAVFALENGADSRGLRARVIFPGGLKRALCCADCGISANREKVIALSG